MSKMFLVALRDNRAGSFLRPVAHSSLAVAVRDVEMDLNRENSILGQFPDDFELCVVAEFDAVTGVVSDYTGDTPVIPVSSLIKE